LNRLRLLRSIIIQFRGGNRAVPLQRSDKEIEEKVFDEDNVLENKTTQDCHLSLWPIKRLKSHLLFREEPQE